MIERLAEALWYGEGAGARAARVILSPLSALFEAAAVRRVRAYDAGRLATVPSTIPVISVGNLSVGGTGKTPFAAMLASRLRAMGRTPAIVMRGYGADEPILHEWLNPGVRVFADADRARAIERAAESGADVVVLDDAFQHRRVARDVDIVLVSVDQWRDDLHLLPAGPLREPLTALGRADLIVMTVKRASAQAIARVRAAVEGVAGGRPIATVRFDLVALHCVGDDHTAPTSVLDDASVLAIAGIGDPSSFFAQLTSLGARVTGAAFTDHHAYSRREVERLATRGAGHKYVVTTAKDAVKLREVWPANGPRLWYVSQAVTVSDGESLIDAAIQRALTR